MRMHWRSTVSLVLAWIATGCASGGQGGAPGDLTSGPQTVELTVANLADGTVTAFAQWRNGPRTLLGVLRAGAVGSYITPYRASEVALTLEAAVPPPATGYPSAYAPTFVQIDMGDTVVFEIIRIFPPNISYRRARE
jgi:hypothetical protein